MQHKVNLAIIGGTGLYHVEGLEVIDTVSIDTAWGKPSDDIIIAEYEGFKVAFLPRHGKGHVHSPTKIPQKANMAALKQLGVEEIIAFSSVGSLKEEVAPTHFVLPSQIIDRTRHREDTYFDEGVVAHASFGDPFDAGLADLLAKHIEALNVPLHRDETLICMEGPAFSTRAESKLYKGWGAGIINMTAIPESKLARELEMSYQMVCMSTDYDSWRESEEAVTTDDILKVVKQNTDNAKLIIKNMMDDIVARGNVESKWKGSIQFGLLSALDTADKKILEKLKTVLPDTF